MVLKSLLLFFFFSLHAAAFTQTVITGVVYDAETKVPLSYVNIGIKNKNIGTVSRPNGTFSIEIPVQNEDDTLTFSMVGCFELNAGIKNIIITNQKSFPLAVKATELSTITVTARALTEKKFGIKNEKALIHFTDGSTNQNDIFEIAQLIRFGTARSKITSVNLLINQARKDSATFRINFYRFDGSAPAERIIEKSIVQTAQIDKGWLKFDLSDSNIYIKGNFVAAIEFIPTTQQSDPISYEVKLGGSAKSFVRSSSQGLWKRPPHHYKMYVTAMVESTKHNKRREVELDDDVETLPAVELFSESVRDSFSIFIKLPGNYNAKRKRNFSVVYLLDGNAYFDAVADDIRKHKKDAILVGIGYKNAFLMDSLRNRDYTFPQAAPQDSFPTSGGADRFLAFIKTELIPFIDKAYRTDTADRCLMGHSLGGYFTLFAMQQGLSGRSNPYKQYVAASPSLYYSDQYLIKALQNTEPGNTNPQTLILTIGENELEEDATIPEYFNSFVKHMNDGKYKNIKLITEVFPSFGHMDTGISTFARALQELK
jgi:predicted alpha/beta superfamily hydrolase